MRLSAEQVKQGIVHPDPIVRCCALRYFSESFSDDPTVMPLVIRAVEEYGWDDALNYHLYHSYLSQTEETLAWLIDRLNKVGRPKTHTETVLCSRLALVISRADVALLMKHEQAILGLEGLETDFRDVIADRLRLMTISTDSNWRELEGLCEEYRGEYYLDDFTIDKAFRLSEAIARDGSCAGRVLSILSAEIENHKNSPTTWMECFAAHMAGQMRLEEATPLLVGKLRDDVGDMMNEECMHSLIKIGTDRAVEVICDDWLASPEHYRSYASASLQGIRSDEVASRCLNLYGQEEDVDFRMRLLQAVLASFSLDGIEPARQFILREDPYLREELVAVAVLGGIEFPELELWRTELKEEREEHERWQEAALAPEPKRYVEPWTSPAIDNLIGPTPVPPIARKEQAGRNDPCPCGSGRKFKKCCMNKAT